jgi:hypothetical protein
VQQDPFVLPAPKVPAEKPQNLITLIPGNPVRAEFSGPTAATVFDLFHTNTLPTPYNSEVPDAAIQRRIQELNPDCAVIWRYSGQLLSSLDALATSAVTGGRS